MECHHYLAFDLGASSGRAFLGSLIKNNLQIHEIHRFKNEGIVINNHVHWNVPQLFSEMKLSLNKCSQKFTPHIESLAIDTWGVDYGLLDLHGNLLGLPYTYRDDQTKGMLDSFEENIMSLEKLYQLSGIQTMQINTIFQLYALKLSNSYLLENASDLLFMPDLFQYLFTGEKKTEYSIATTSQLLEPYSKKWNNLLFLEMNIPISLMQEIIPQGTVIGKVDKDICKNSQMDEISAVSVASHDTSSAIAAIAAFDDQWAYLSSGTWSLMGIESESPIINNQSISQNFTNEGGVNGKYLFLKNMCGLWLLQQCKKKWDQYESISYNNLIQLATKVSPCRIIINPDDPDFLNPVDMIWAIDSFCKKSGQRIPSTQAEYVRCILDSLAMSYRKVFNQLQDFSPKPIKKLFVIGGGGNNKLLCQLTSDALGIPVISGPSESTAIGNILLQAKSFGQVDSFIDIRNIVLNSFRFATYIPKDTQIWEEKEKTMHKFYTTN